jgi:predicted peptidase
VLYLHHAGEKGQDNVTQVYRDAGIGMLMLPEHQAKHPCFVVAPQLPVGTAWADMSFTAATSSRHPEPNDHMRMALEIADAVCKEFPIDPGRIYVTGTSLGGFGTWEAVSRRPHFFAAALPTCGGYDENAARLFLDTPIWTFHGNADEIIHVDRTRHMVDAVRTAGGTIRYWELDGLPHETSRDVAYSTPAALDWLFHQHRVTR